MNVILMTITGTLVPHCSLSLDFSGALKWHTALAMPFLTHLPAPISPLSITKRPSTANQYYDRANFIRRGYSFYFLYL